MRSDSGSTDQESRQALLLLPSKRSFRYLRLLISIFKSRQMCRLSFFTNSIKNNFSWSANDFMNICTKILRFDKNIWVIAILIFIGLSNFYCWASFGVEWSCLLLTTIFGRRQLANCRAGLWVGFSVSCSTRRANSSRSSRLSRCVKLWLIYSSMWRWSRSSSCLSDVNYFEFNVFILFI